jgi:probable rRNA maturation factor
MIDIEKKSRIEIGTDHLEKIAEKLTDRNVELLLCDNEEIKFLNSKYRNIQSATDVLSFPLEGSMQHMPLGSLVISLEKVVEKSSELNHSPEEELALLFIHGLLHLLGYDHEKDHGDMRRKEIELIRYFNLPESLIERT